MIKCLNIGQLQTLAYIMLIVYILYGLRKTTIRVKVVSVVTIILALTIGARLFYVIYSGDTRVDTIFSLKLGYFKIAGGLIGALLGTLLLCKLFQKDKSDIYNSVIEGLFLAGGIAKLNCHLVGCCYGKATTLPWGISYPTISIYHVHPVAFYEAIILWIGFIFLIMTKGKMKDSSRISISIGFYTIVRMLLLEGLYSGGVWFGTTTSRILYCCMLIVCLIIIIRNYYNNCKKSIAK